MYHTIGAKYEQVKGMDIRDIAKLVRADIKTLLPEIKASVRIERFSMGQSLYITVKPVEEGYREVTQRILRKITDQYNYDDSDSMTDYFNVNFYSDIYIEREA